MTFLFQLTLFAFIALSFLLVVGVPVAFASQKDGRKIKEPSFQVLDYGSYWSFSRSIKFLCGVNRLLFTLVPEAIPWFASMPLVRR
jgi:photosystem II core protein PsbZ